MQSAGVRKKIGIRMALCSRPGQVLRQVFLSGTTLVWIGVAAGLGCALWATSFLRALLFSVNSRNPHIYPAVVLSVIAVALLANFVPARRAAAIDPMRALHFE